MVLARFINTAIVPTIVNSSVDRWFVNGGLVQSFFTIMISLSFVSPIIQLLDPEYILKKIKKWYYWGKKDKCPLTQGEADQ